MIKDISMLKKSILLNINKVIKTTVMMYEAKNNRQEIRLNETAFSAKKKLNSTMINRKTKTDIETIPKSLFVLKSKTELVSKLTIKVAVILIDVRFLNTF